MGDSKDQVHMLCFFKTERKYGVVKSNMIIEYSSTMEIGMNSPIQQVEWPTRKGGTTKITRYSAVLVERSGGWIIDLSGYDLNVIEFNCKFRANVIQPFC